jgi:signal transduction histidine kinase
MSSTRAAAVTLAAFLLALVCLVQPRSGPVPFSAYLLFAGSLALECSATPLPYGRAFSFAAPIYLVIAWLPGLGPAAAVLALFLSLAGRVFLAPRTTTKSVALLSDFASGTIALATPVLFKMVGFALEGPEQRFFSLLAYIILDFWLPSFLLGSTAGDQLALQIRLTPLRVGAFLLAPLMASQLALGGLSYLLAIPLLLACSGAARGVILEQNARKADIAEKQKLEAEQAQRQTESRLHKTDQSLRRQLSERELLEELSRAFLNSPDLRTVFLRAAKVIDRIVPAQSVGFFQASDGRLEAVFGLGPWEKAMKSARLLGLTEPLIDECWQRRELVISKAAHCVEQRIFADEATAVAFPLGGFGVLYIGCKEPSRLSREVLRDLAVLADQTLLAAIAAVQREQLEEALAQGSLVNTRLEDTNIKLRSLLDGAASLAQTLEPQDVLIMTQALVRRLLPAQDLGAIRFQLESTVFEHHWPETLSPDPAFLEMVDVCKESGLALRIDQIKVSRFQTAPFPDTQSVLAVPIGGKGSVIGAVVVASPKAGEFTTTDQDTLSALCFQIHAVLLLCALHRKLKESQAQLVQSSKMGALGSLSAGIAHEINTPLAAIRIAVQGAKLNARKGDLDKCSAKLDRAENATRLAQEIISKLLIFSRRSSSQATAIELFRVVVNAVDMVSAQLASDGVAIELPSNSGSLVLANSNEIHQVVLNLLLNARDAMKTVERSKAKITLLIVESQNTVELHVADSGPGISDEVLGRVFEPFFTTKAVGEGTGLGLSVSQSLVESYHGTISAHNRNEGGACFVVTLPRATSKVAQLS